MKQNRRGFLKMLGLAPLAGAAAIEAIKASPIEAPDVITEVEEEGSIYVGGPGWEITCTVATSGCFGEKDWEWEDDYWEDED